MVAPMLRMIAACIISTFVMNAVVAADPEEAIKARLNKAKADFDAEFLKAKTDLIAQLDLKLESATKAGELALVKKLRAEREDFAEKGEMPKSVPTKDFNAAGKKAFDRMAAAFVQARKEYTQASKIEEAEAVDKELDEFVKSGGRTTKPLPGAIPQVPKPVVGGKNGVAAYDEYIDVVRELLVKDYETELARARYFLNVAEERVRNAKTPREKERLGKALVHPG